MLANIVRNQQGDTVIEMMIAFVIISSVLIGSYTIANRAFRTTQIARERTQATQFLQQQAEAVYAVYNTMGWQDFHNSIDGAAYDTFHIEKTSAQAWKLQSGAYTPQVNGNPSIYKVKVEKVGAGLTANEVELKLTISWDRIGGGGPKETSTLYLHLTNRNFTGS